MGRYQKFMLPTLIIVIFVILVVSFRSFLLANIIEPIALLLWAIWHVISSVDQHIYWVILIVIYSILAIRLLPSGIEDSHESAYGRMDQSPSRVDYWQSLIKDAALGSDENERLHGNLKNLLLTVVDQDERAETVELEDVIAKGKTPLSLTTQRLLFPQNEADRNFPVGQRLKFLYFGPRWLRGWANRFVHQDYTLMDETLRWMEIELELNDEN